MAVDLSNTTALILVGGLGTRLRPVIADVPKPMAPVDGRPFLECLVEQLRDGGFRDIVMCVGHLGHVVESHFGDGSSRDLRIRYSQERELLGTAGAIGAARSLIQSEDFLAMNGDAYCAVDFPQFAAAHATAGAAITIAAMEVPSRARFGRLILDGSNTITAFEEKDGVEEPGWINGGLYFMNRAVRESIPLSKVVSLEREIFPAWVGRGLMAFRTAGTFIDIGLPEELERAQLVLRRPPSQTS